MQIMLKDIKRLTQADIEAFLAGSKPLDFSVQSAEAYLFIESVLANQHYSKLSRKSKGSTRRFLMKITALSRAQVTRLIERWQDCRQVRRKAAQRPDFPRIYTAGDIALLAAMDTKDTVIIPMVKLRTCMNSPSTLRRQPARTLAFHSLMRSLRRKGSK